MTNAKRCALIAMALSSAAALLSQDASVMYAACVAACNGFTCYERKNDVDGVKRWRLVDGETCYETIKADPDSGLSPGTTAVSYDEERVVDGGAGCTSPGSSYFMKMTQCIGLYFPLESGSHSCYTSCAAGGG